MQVFKLGLWSALVFFDHGSEMQLATALVTNVLQLCIHVYVLPMGGEDGPLLNLMQTCTLVLTTYINFGALTMNSLVLSQTLARIVEPASVDEYDAPIIAISLLMQLLTFGTFLSFGGVAIKKGATKAHNLDVRGGMSAGMSAIRSRFGSSANRAETPAIAEAQGGGGPPSFERSVDFASTSNPLRREKTDGIELTPAAAVHSRQLSTEVAPPAALPSPARSHLPSGWKELVTDNGDSYYHNSMSGVTSWSLPEVR